MDQQVLALMEKMEKIQYMISGFQPLYNNNKTNVNIFTYNEMPQIWTLDLNQVAAHLQAGQESPRAAPD